MTTTNWGKKGMIPTLRDIYLARQKIYPLARHTPLVHSAALSIKGETAVYLKLETVQEIGAFKIRGAANKILGLAPDQKERGVVTVSTGNHGRAVAYVAQQVGIRAVVCISEQVPANKVAAIEQLGAEVVICGQSQDDAGERAEQLMAEQGLAMIHPFDDPYIIAGQGTIGLELLQERPSLNSVLVPLSGGGLIAGIGLALKAADPVLRVIGVSMERSPVMYHSLQAGHPVQLEELPTLADSLQGASVWITATLTGWSRNMSMKLSSSLRKRLRQQWPSPSVSTTWLLKEARPWASLPSAATKQATWAGKRPLSLAAAMLI
jgi:threonine dehydratase